MNSYQKLKTENVQLREDIYNLVMNADKLTGYATKMKYELLYKSEEHIMTGHDTIMGYMKVSPKMLEPLSNVK